MFMVIVTYKNFKWWQKTLFYIGLPQVLNLFFWIVFLPLFHKLNPKYKNQNYKETMTKLFYYFGYVHLIVIGIALILGSFSG